MAVIALMGIILTLGATAGRNFWLVQSLYSGRDGVLTQFRQLQGRVVSESNPNVYGVRLVDNSTTYDVVRYLPASGTNPASCAKLYSGSPNSGLFGGGVKITLLSPTASPYPGFPVPASGTPAGICNTALSGSATDQYVFFYARGTAGVTPGASTGSVQLTQPALNRTLRLTVTSLTGRVDST
jgi:hypothetical protein